MCTSYTSTAVCSGRRPTHVPPTLFSRPLLGAGVRARRRIFHMPEETTVRRPPAGTAEHERQRRHHERAVIVDMDDQCPGAGLHAMRMISIPRELRRFCGGRHTPRKTEILEARLRLRGSCSLRLAVELRLPVDGRHDGIVFRRCGILLGGGRRPRGCARTGGLRGSWILPVVRHRTPRGQSRDPEKLEIFYDLGHRERTHLAQQQPANRSVQRDDCRADQHVKSTRTLQSIS
jgi:hypothetical protein